MEELTVINSSQVIQMVMLNGGNSTLCLFMKREAWIFLLWQVFRWVPLKIHKRWERFALGTVLCMSHHQHCSISKEMFCIVELLQLVWIETPTNPTLKVIDIQGCADVIHKHKDILLAVDNSFMSAYFQVSTCFLCSYPSISVSSKMPF